MFVLSQNIKSLKVKHKDWNKNVFGDININFQVTEYNLHQIQSQTNDSVYNNNLLVEEKVVDRIKSKLTTLKASLISIVGRVQVIRF